MKLNCIIDTCTCIILSNTEFNQKRVLDYFNKVAHLNFSTEVHIELKDHREKNLPKFIHDKNRKLTCGKFSINDYEKRMLGNVIPSRKKKGNKGETDNFLISVDQIHHFKKGSVIFITDDSKAVNGIIGREWLASFPTIKLWSSYDVIIYLYAEKIIPSKDIAKELIQDVINFSTPKPSSTEGEEERNLRQKTINEIIKTKVEYSRRIENISKLLN